VRGIDVEKQMRREGSLHGIDVEKLPSRRNIEMSKSKCDARGMRREGSDVACTSSSALQSVAGNTRCNTLGSHVRKDRGRQSNNFAVYYAMQRLGAGSGFTARGK